MTTVGLKAHVIIHPDGCTGGIKITAHLKFKLVLPGLIRGTSKVLSKLVPVLPNVNALSKWMQLKTFEQTLPAGVSPKDVRINIAGLMPPPHGQIFDLLGLEVSFNLLTSKMGRFEKGIELPVDVDITMLRKESMKLPVPACGARRYHP